jgi:hypothetical protein
LPDTTSGIVTLATCCFGLRGNVDADPQDQINVADVTFLVAYLFQSGAAPVCAMEADCDAVLPVSVADLTLLVGYLFQDGPAPEACP